MSLREGSAPEHDFSREQERTEQAFREQIKHVRERIENPLVRELYETLSSEELETVTSLVRFLTEPGAIAYWSIHGKPIGVANARRGDGADYADRKVSGLKQEDYGFWEEYRKQLDSLYKSEPGLEKLIGLPAHPTNGLEIVIGDGKKKQDLDSKDVILQGVVIRGRNCAGKGSQSSGYETRGATQTLTMLVNVRSPFMEWLRTTDNLRPLTFALREAAMFLDPRKVGESYGRDRYSAQEMLDGTFEPLLTNVSPGLAHPNRAVILDLWGARARQAMNDKDITGELIIHKIEYDKNLEVRSTILSRDVARAPTEEKGIRRKRSLLSLVQRERVFGATRGNAFIPSW